MAAGSKWRIVYVICCVMLVDKAMTSQELLMKMSKGFGKGIEECKAELNSGDKVMDDFMNYWREEYQLVNRDFGCMIACLAKKHDLLNDDSNLHHVNAHEFAKTHGADEDTAKRIVEMLHECDKVSTGDDACLKTLDMAKCFRTKIHEVKWAPNWEVLLEELMAGGS